tara:strand:+ start:1208 stop:4357 length:3150 start_codon:yes stop_codon:yes gene_type:complete
MKFTKYIIFIFIIPIYCQFGKNIVQYKKFDWYYLQSKHFDIYYYENDTNAQYVADESLNAYNNISNAIGWKLKNRIPIIVYNSHNDFQQTNVIDMYMPEGVGGVTELYKNRVVIPYDGSHIQFRNVLHHELVHAFINDYIYKGSIKSIQKDDVVLVPLWMNEGLAEFLSASWDANSEMWIRDLVINGERLPKLNELNGYLAYRGGQSVWKFIVEKLDTAYINQNTKAPTIIASIFSAIATSANLDDALEKSIGFGLKDLEKEWHKYLKAEYWPDINNRQYINDIGFSLIDYEKVNNTYDIAPSISPNGKYVAYYSNQNGLMNISIIPSDCNQCKSKSIKSILKAGMSIDFEELQILKPGISWSADSKNIIFASSSKGSDLLFIINIETQKKEKIIFPNSNLMSISQPIWNPVFNNLIAFVACDEKQSDIYIYNLDTKQLTNMVDDIFTEKEISWSSDGEYILFSSNRSGIDSNDWEDQYDLYAISKNRNSFYQLTDTPYNEHYPISIYSDSLMVYISDQNGINNIYAMDYELDTTSNSMIITNVFTGITHITAQNNDLYFTSLNNSKFNLYKLDTLLIDNIDFNKTHNFPSVKWKQNMNDYDFTLLNYTFDRKRTSYRNYIFQPTVLVKKDSSILLDDDFVKDSLGNYISHKYKTKFSLDIGQLSVGVGLSTNNNNYTQNGMAIFQFSDILGDHKIYLGTELNVNFRRSDYALVYRYLPNLIDWTFLFSHDGFLNFAGEEIIDGSLIQYQTLYQNIKLGFDASRPLSRFNKLEFQMNYYALLIHDEIIDATIYDNILSSDRRYSGFINTVSLRYVWDNTRWFYTHPINGYRFYLKYKTVPSYSYDSNLLTLDGRIYHPLGNGISFMFRNFLGHSWGKDNQKFYLGSEPSIYTSTPNVADYYLNQYRGIDYDDLLLFFNFSENISPIRGFPFMYKAGHNVALFNIELRAPFLLYYFPTLKWIGQINGILFLDIGVTWDNSTSFPSFQDGQNWLVDENNFTPDNGWVMSYGWGPRFIILGMPLKINYVWQYNPISKQISNRRYEVTIGIDL